MRVADAELPRPGTNATRARSLSGLPSWGEAVLLVLYGCTLGTLLGWQDVVVDGILSQSDSYQRLNRILASIEAGNLLAYIPRDNAGAAVALHWSHLLDALVLVVALPLMPLFGVANALHYGGAAIGPLSLGLAGLSVPIAVRRFTGVRAERGVAVDMLLIGILAMAGPAVVSYGTLGQVDHHVLMGALAVLAVAFAFALPSELRDRKSAIVGGTLCGIGPWLSPEFTPFVLLAWAIATLCDLDRSARIGERAVALSSAFLLTLVVAFVVDPPWPSRWAAEADRLSHPHVELALAMTAASWAGSRLSPRLEGPWHRALLAAGIAAIGIVPWLALYPELLQGPSGIFSEIGRERIWSQINEMQPLDSPKAAMVWGIFPTLALVGTCAWGAVRDFRPMQLLLLGAALGVAILAWLHVRFSLYLQIGAAVAMGVFLTETLARQTRQSSRIAAVAVVLCLAFAPILSIGLVPTDKDSSLRGPCPLNRVAPRLGDVAGRVVLTEPNYAPSLIYFTRAVAVAGPYHRNEPLIIAALEAFDETAFEAGMPRSFAATGAAAVLVCGEDTYPEASLGAALAKGAPPQWLRELPLRDAHGFRLFVVR